MASEEADVMKVGIGVEADIDEEDAALIKETPIPFYPTVEVVVMFRPFRFWWIE